MLDTTCLITSKPLSLFVRVTKPDFLPIEAAVKAL